MAIAPEADKKKQFVFYSVDLEFNRDVELLLIPNHIDDTSEEKGLEIKAKIDNHINVILMDFIRNVKKQGEQNELLLLINSLKNKPVIESLVNEEDEANLTKGSSKCDNSECKNEEKDKRFVKCGNCKAIYYCDKKCQKIDWPKHKNNCNKFIELSGIAETLRNQIEQIKNKNSATPVPNHYSLFDMGLMKFISDDCGSLNSMICSTCGIDIQKIPQRIIKKFNKQMTMPGWYKWIGYKIFCSKKCVAIEEDELLQENKYKERVLIMIPPADSIDYVVYLPLIDGIVENSNKFFLASQVAI